MAEAPLRLLALAEVGARRFQIVEPGRYLTGELTVRIDFDGTDAIDGVLSRANFNVSSARARTDRAAHVTLFRLARECEEIERRLRQKRELQIEQLQQALANLELDRSIYEDLAVEHAMDAKFYRQALSVALGRLHRAWSAIPPELSQAVQADWQRESQRLAEDETRGALSSGHSDDDAKIRWC